VKISFEVYDMDTGFWVGFEVITNKVVPNFLFVKWLMTNPYVRAIDMVQ
jgi:hypothetical protein